MRVHYKKPFIFALLVGVILPSASQAGLLEWQNQVLNIGVPVVAYKFDAVTAPTLFDVGALSGDRTFEFIVNAGLGGESSVLLGGGQGAQALKFEQWSNTGVFGVTAYGIADYNSTIAPPLNATTEVAFVSNGSSTDMYVAGAYSYTFSGFSLNLSGLLGLAGGLNNNGSFSDPMDGTILGFASYDSALPAAEIAQHAAALAVPEPSSVALLSLGGVALLRRQRRSSAARSKQVVV
jgi:hypothetical protein